jgi:hypothetical protein
LECVCEGSDVSIVENGQTLSFPFGPWISATRTSAGPHWMVKVATPLQCSNGLDDDGDGLTDVLDPDCTGGADNSEYHLSQGDIVAVSYEMPPALYRVDPVDGALTDLIVSGLVTPWGVAMGPAGLIYVSDPGADAIYELDTSDGNLREVASGGALTFPRSILVEPDGNLLVADGGAQEVFRIDPASGIPVGILTDPTCDDILEPRVLEPPVVHAGVAYVTDGWTGDVYAILSDNTCADLSLGFGSEITNPWGLVATASGEVLVVDSTSKEVIEIDLGTGIETPKLPVFWNFNVPRGMTFEADGKLLVADYLNEAIYRLDLKSPFTQVALATGPRFTDVAVVTTSSPPPTQVPALPPFGLALLTCGLSVAAMRRLRSSGQSTGSGSETGS